MYQRADLKVSQRWVIKVGSALLTNSGRGLDTRAIQAWVEQMVRLREYGIEIVLVSSGSVAEGMGRLGWQERPQTIHELQAAAAIGQMGLVHAYEEQFSPHNIYTAQVLLDHDDLSNRSRYLNARATIQTLLSLRALPIVNENDTVATDEIRFGDNDTLAALVTNLIQADVLVILTDQDGLFDSDPRKNSTANLIHESRAADTKLDIMAGGSSGRLGRGGMLTKLRAARLASRSGAHTLIANGAMENILPRLHAGEMLGTLLVADEKPMTARKRWLAGQLQVSGRLVLDAGAVDVLRGSGKSLLAVGVREVHGDFLRGEMVSCTDAGGVEIARGLINYSAPESQRIAGKASTEIIEILGYMNDEELIHRDNMVILA